MSGRFRSALAALKRQSTGSTAVEFALLLPMFMLFIFAIVEIGLAIFFSLVLNLGADAGMQFLLEKRRTYATISESALRAAICAAFPANLMSCDSSMLKVALINADSPSSSTLLVPRPISNSFASDAGQGDAYLLAIGYNWKFLFPVTGYVLPYSGPNPQVQVVQMVVLTQRVTE